MSGSSDNNGTMMARTQRVRICVVIDPEGKWEAAGSHTFSDKEAQDEVENNSSSLGGSPWGYHWVEADVPVPVERPEQVIEGEVSGT